MSSLIGTPEERWSLARAIDALGESARQAGHPGLVWIAGLLYPSLALGLEVAIYVVLKTMAAHVSPGETGADGNLPERFVFVDLVKTIPWPMMGLLLLAPCFGIFLLPLFRLMAGLARLGPARAWQSACAGRRAPRLSQVWRAGEGLTFPTFGLVVQLAFMMAAAIAVTTLPVLGLVYLLQLPEESPGSVALVAGLIGPVVVVLVLYSLALSILTQLALHSLAHNRRGVHSALLHGWRIMRNDGWATARAVLVDVVLFVTISLIGSLFAGWAMVLGAVGTNLATLVKLLLLSFAGVARAGYWARAYRALGGLSPDDGVPGL